MPSLTEGALVRVIARTLRRCPVEQAGLRSSATRHTIELVTEIETIGARIKRHRMDAGMTQRDLAGKVGVGVPHISKVEANRENPSDDLIHRLADVFRIDVDELFLTARRLPPALAEEMASDPARALQFFRTMRNEEER
jgi:transcriptional regulator with XRE-family HTH domain